MGRRSGGNGSEKSLKQPSPGDVDGTSTTKLSFAGDDKPQAGEPERSAALMGAAARLRRDTVVILRLDGQDLEEFIGEPEFEEVAAAAYSLHGPAASLRDIVLDALAMLTIDHGMPPSSDPLVIEDVVQPAMSFVSVELQDQPVSIEGFVIVYRKIVEGLAQRLKEHPVIVAYCEDMFDGSDINWLLSAKSELDKLLNSAWRTVAKENDRLTAKEFMNNVLNKIIVFTGLPPYGTVDQFDFVIGEAYQEVNQGNDKFASKEDFENKTKGILQNIMYKLEKNPISISSTTVVNEHSSQPL